MKTHHFPENSNWKGFTLIEILVVIAIIAVLATITVQGLGFYQKKSKENKSTVFVASVSQALDSYRSDEGSYPQDGADGSDTSSEVLYESLFGDLDGDGQPDDGATIYLDTLNPGASRASLNVEEAGGSYTLVDGFKNPLYYRAPGEQNPATEFDLWSAGVDGETNISNSGDETRDDINNW